MPPTKTTSSSTSSGLKNAESGQAGFEVKFRNLPLFERRRDAWALAFLIDRLEEPLAALHSECLRVQSYGEERGLLSFLCGGETSQQTVGVPTDPAEWLLHRTHAAQACLLNLGTAVNIDLQMALKPKAENANPAGLEEFSFEILKQCRRLLEVEQEVASNRLPQSLLDQQQALIGLSAGVVARLQAAVSRMREFVEKEDGDRFSLEIDFNFPQLIREKPNAPPQLIPKPNANPRMGFSGCFFLCLTAFVLSFFLPFSIVILILVIGGTVAVLTNK